MTIKYKKLFKHTSAVFRILCVGVMFSIPQLPTTYGMEPTQEKDAPTQIAHKHFAEDKNLIHNLLKNIKEAQLHFFWTTGITLSDNPSYHPITQVSVGGDMYGTKFFSYVDMLLENAPENLKVKFVCDEMTRKSNEKRINELISKYHDRFEIILVDKVKEKLLQTFDQKYHPVISTIFINATQGNPVMTSDINRIIGMPYGQELFLADIMQILFTYCDIDTFCYGMEDGRHDELIKALFREPVKKDPFFLGMRKGNIENNDIIKLWITDPVSYKRFSEDQILSHIRERNQGGDTSYFHKLYEIIKRCETSNPETTFYNELLGGLLPSTNGMNVNLMITLATGPKFLGVRDEISPLSETYPAIYAAAWRGPEEILKPRQEAIAAEPASQYAWNPLNEQKYQKEKTALDIFKRECEQYKNVLQAAFLAKRYGNDHPFNIQIRNYLKIHFPYHSVTFRNFLKMNFLAWCDQNISLRNSENNETYQQWKLEVFNDITDKGVLRERISSGRVDDYDGHYVRLGYLLHQLGIEVPFTEENVDFRKY